jgi:hypothetical protein
MRSTRRLIVVAAAILAFGVLAPSVSAAGPHPRNFHLTKTCESAVLCTILHANFKPFRPGTDVTYTFDDSDPWDGLTFPTIVVKHSSTTGVCDWNQPAGPVVAKCSFGSGTGRLTQFHLDVDVTVVGDPENADAIWHWDGTYWFGHGHGHGPAHH